MELFWVYEITDSSGIIELLSTPKTTAGFRKEWVELGFPTRVAIVPSADDKKCQV